VPEPATKPAQELAFVVVSRAEGGMTSLGVMNTVCSSAPGEKRLTQSGPRADDGDGAVLLRFTILQRHEIARPQSREAARQGVEIVDQDDLRDVYLGRQCCGVYHPGQIHRAAAAVDHRPRNSEARPVRHIRYIGEKRVGDRRQ
jgi:hypothetical protein